MMKRIISISVMLLTCVSVYSQVENTPPVIDYSYNDSAAVNKDSSTNKDNPSNTSEVPLKPYERIVLNMDSNTNLITYAGVVEQEESGSDSLYFRARRFGEHMFGKNRSVFEVDKKGIKLVMNGYIPAYAYLNRYNKKLNGRYGFRMTVLVKEGRYKYTITNLVHESVTPASGKGTRNYFEYYYTSTQNVRLYDNILRCADIDIKNTIARFQSAMREPKYLDEDEW